MANVGGKGLFGDQNKLKEAKDKEVKSKSHYLLNFILYIDVIQYYATYRNAINIGKRMQWAQFTIVPFKLHMLGIYMMCSLR